ncbi:MAG: DUF4861 domain-containing protein [Bacteroidales bacterium]|jgi:hypothetical protein|nr:DUF4861 domain-containing protein [Bacteroidales bacterium]
MKKVNLFLLAFFSLFFCNCNGKNAQIVVENSLDFDRKGEMAEVATANLKADFGNKSYVLKNEKGEEVAYQLSVDKKSLIFLADVPAGAKTVYTLQEGTPAPVAIKTNARFVPERSDDFAWENDIAAFRMYGAALEKIENPSNGVDIWMKYRDEPVMDSIYAGRLRKLSYHEDNGLGGFDSYDVKHTLGAGGNALYTDKFWIGDAFDSHIIHECGPLRSVFSLVYDTIKVGETYYKEIITITTEAGSILNKAVVRYEGLEQPIRLAAGIFMHGDSVNTVFDRKNNTLAYTKNTVTNKGIDKGQTYIGMYVPVVTSEAFYEDRHIAILSDYVIGSDFTYYFGGAWNGWKFPSEQDWLTALTQFSQAKRTPLKITTI